MGVRLTSQEDVVALFDSVSGFAFGPTFPNEAEAQQFLAWAHDLSGCSDLRSLSDRQIEVLVSDFYRATGLEAG